DEPSDDARDRLAENALKQIMIALYRAMADEFAFCFVNQTASPVEEGSADRLYELSGKFRLDLDQGAEPGALREYWEEVGCLRRGVLWPRLIGDAAELAGLRDKGMREIQALATAAQAFQVCSGAVTYQETIKDAKAREQTLSAKLGVDLAGLVNRLIGLTVGGLLGYGVAGAAGAAGGGGAGRGGERDVVEQPVAQTRRKPRLPVHSRSKSAD